MPGAVAVAAICALAAACGRSPVRPTPPPAAPLMTCPAAVDVESPDDGPMTVHWDAPVVVGGAPPVAVTCSPGSGTPFGIGVTPVTCSAADALGQAASCSFQVTVRAAPRLAFTSFLAFGDSLTEGKVSVALDWLLSMPSESYPFKLRHLLAERYRRQPITMVNAGIGGEQTTRGMLRFRGELQRHRPDVVLLMEGTNDLINFHEEAVARAIPALQSMIREAKQSGVQVLLATVPPMRPGGRRDREAQLVPAFNQEVRALAAREGVPLVDVHAAMQDKPSLIGQDDLHMTEEGYGFMAQAFFEAIRTSLEAPPSPARHW